MSSTFTRLKRPLGNLRWKQTAVLGFDPAIVWVVHLIQNRTKKDKIREPVENSISTILSLIVRKEEEEGEPVTNAVGVDIGGTKMLIAAEVNGSYVDRTSSTGNDCKIEHIKREVDAFIAELPYEVDVLGLAVPGLVDEDSVVKFSDLYNLNGVSIDYFTEGKMRGKIINDVKAATWAEIANYPDSNTIAVVMCGTGLAIGVYTNGEMFLGGSGYAGELGYCILSDQSGQPRTVDELAGGAGILRRAQCEVSELLKRIAQNETEACQIIREAGKYFGYTLTNVAHLFNPDVIVVGGSTVNYAGYMDEALATAEKLTIKEIFNTCKIVGAQDNKRIVALGAIEFAQSA